MKRWFFSAKQKTPTYYKELLIKADLGLHDQIADTLCSEVKKNGEILDFGAGEGALSARLSDLGYKVTAVDMDSENFKCKEVNFFKLNFDSPVEIERFVTANEGKFDAVLGVEVIEHVQDQWLYTRNLMRMLKPGGVVLITTPNTESWMSRLQFFRTGRFHQFSDADLSYGHINPITPWELKLVMTGANAKDIKMAPGGTLPAIYWEGLNRITLLNILVLFLRPFMRGQLDGWCIIATGRKDE
ncbi:methyltransferase type 11 [Pseudomonas sp. Os17]|uniref:class I SAM-dependent methyltransferase n=1 Tax=Pseudomonas sp. Os17 TaxID=1500686 RepID=UPI0005FCB95E|nr:methyltransferase domain-containing protein [Pseudomonas sp. Os17]BAQ76685.1 methyltransferase type 11 [Pseudomonas sp. Os17]